MDAADRRGREIAILLCDDFTSGGPASRGAAGRGRRFVVVSFATGPRVGASLKKIDSMDPFFLGRGALARFRRRAQGWHRIRSQQNAPIAAPHAAPSPPAQSSLRPAAAPSYHPRPLPRAAQRRALRFSPQIHAHFSRSQIGRFLRRSGASGRLLGTRGRARGGSIAPNSIFAGVPRATS